MIRKNGFSIDRIQTFQKVVAHGSIAKAAENNPVRQSLYSRQISELEDAIGGKLFDRKGKKLILNSLGKDLAVASQGFFASLSDIQSKAESDSVTVRIGAGESAHRWVLMPKFGILQRELEGVCIELIGQSTQDVRESLETGRVDIGILREDAVPQGVSSEFLVAMEFFLVVPRQLLPQKSAGGLQLLRMLPIAATSGEGRLNSAIQILAKKEGFKIRYAARVPTLDLVREAVLEGNVAGILPKSILSEFDHERFAKMEFEEIKQLKRNLVLAFHPMVAQNRSIISRTVEAIRKAYSSP